MDRGSARPASSRQRIDVSTDDKRILEAAARTPAVLDAFNMQWMLVAAAVKPVSAKAADIGAAALGKLLGTVKYVGLPHNEQVDTTQFRLPDRTAGPASPPLVQLPNGLSAAVDGVINHARAMAQRASRAMERECVCRCVRGMERECTRYCAQLKGMIESSLEGQLPTSSCQSEEVFVGMFVGPPARAEGE